MYIGEADTSGFSCSSALLSGASGKACVFKDKGSFSAMLSVKNISKTECLSVQKPYPPPVGILISIADWLRRAAL